MFSSVTLSIWTWKIKTTVNGSKNVKKNYSPVDKSLASEGTGEENVYEQYTEDLGGLNIPNDEVSEEIKHLRLITEKTAL